MTKLMAATRARLDRVCSFMLPPADAAGSDATPAERERLRRGRLLAPLGLLMLAILALLGPDCILLRPAWPFALGLLCGACVRIVAAELNRRGRIEAACRVSMLSILLTCGVAIFASPAGTVVPTVFVYPFLVLAVIQSGFLVGRRAPFAVASIACAIVWAHTAQNAGDPVALAQAGGVRNLLMAPLLASQLFVIAALLTWLNAASTERALAEADRKDEVERLLAERNASHSQLEEAHRHSREQAAELVQMNEELLSMKQELEANYQHLEALNRQLEEQATTDGLTGLANRRMFQQTLRVRVAQAIRQQQPLAMLMVDVDHFKHYNDEFGHPAGDEVLRDAARLLAAGVRIGDLVARYGGEEFAVILPDAEMAAAVTVANRLRTSIARHAFAHRAVTVSVGVASLHIHAPDADTLIREADVALYKAKAAGRDRVMTASEDGCDADPAMALSAFDGSPTRDPEGGAVTARQTLIVEVADAYGGIEGLLQEPSGPVLTALLAALDVRDAETQGHSQRVARYALHLAHSVAKALDRKRTSRPLVAWLTPADLRALALGALLHDIGKMRIPDRILRKTGPLTEDEWSVVRRHPIVGAELVYEFPQLAPALPVVLHHHERWDGSGYPDGLAGEQIPLAARIFAVCDTLDAITTDRPYRAGLPYSAAAEEIRRESGMQFDPLIVEAFCEVTEQEWHALSGLPSEGESQAEAA